MLRHAARRQEWEYPNEYRHGRAGSRELCKFAENVHVIRLIRPADTERAASITRNG